MTAQSHRFNLVLKPAGVTKLQAVATRLGKTKAQTLRDLLDTAYLMMSEGHPHCVSGQVCLFPQSHPQLAQFATPARPPVTVHQPEPIGPAVPSDQTPKGEPS